MTQLAITSVMVTSGCATAPVIDPSVCAQVGRSHGQPSGRYETVAPKDFGRGFVMGEISSNTVYSATNMDFLVQTDLLQCATGQSIIFTRASRDGTAETAVDQRAEVDMLFDEAAHLPADAVFTYLADRATALNVPFSTFVSDDREDCGCRLFYPELRGDKIEYEGTL